MLHVWSVYQHVLRNDPVMRVIVDEYSIHGAYGREMSEVRAFKIRYAILD
jgi:hypothetical protein